MSLSIKTHYIRPKWAIESPFLESKTSDFLKKNIQIMLKFTKFSISKFIPP
jgi:hypothetical protein